MAELKYVDWDGLVYYDSKIKEYIKDRDESYAKIGGLISFEQLPDPTPDNLHYLYKITNNFETDGKFDVEGSYCSEGTWVICVDYYADASSYKYVVLTSNSTSNTDLTNYYTKSEVDELIDSIEEPDLSQFITQEQLDTTLEDFVTTTEVDSLVQEIGTLEAIVEDKVDRSEITDLATKDFVLTKIAEAELSGKDVDLSNYYTKSEVDGLIPEHVSELENDAGYISEHQDISHLATKEELADAIKSIEHPTIDLTGYATEQWVESKGYLTEHQDLSEYAKKSDLPLISSIGESSVVQPGGNNVALTSNSAAFGIDNISGVKWFEIDTVDSSSKTITFKSNVADSGLASGDIFTIFDGSKNFLNCGTVFEIISNNAITYAEDSIPVTSGCFYVIEKPHIGDTFSEGNQVTFGENTRALRKNDFAQGNDTIACGKHSHAEGHTTIASGYISHSEGWGTKATAAYAHSEGVKTIASNQGAHTEGQETEAAAIMSHAEGYKTRVGEQGACSHTEGGKTQAHNQYAHAEGYETIVNGLASHTEGYQTTADGSYTHAEGGNTKSEGEFTHAEGSKTVASGSASHAEGIESKTRASAAHAEGYYTESSGAAAHSEGHNTKAKAESSHSEGRGTVAASANQHVQGKYNVEDADNTYAHIVGNGKDSSNRSNAYTLDWEGNARFEGSVFVGGATIDSEAKRLATEDFVNTELKNNYITQAEIEETYVTQSSVEDVVSIEVTKVIQEKVETGEIELSANSIFYGDF